MKGVYGARRPDVINGSAKLIIFSARKLATGLAKALAACKKHEAKLIVANLNPPSRNITLVDKLLESKIKFIAVDMPFADKMRIRLMSIFSEHECEMVSARTKAALEAAKASGNVLDNPNIKVISQKRRAKVSTKADQFAEALRPIIVDLQKRSIDTLSAIAEELNIRRIKTYRNDGSKWHVSTVKSLMKRLG